MTTLSQPLQDKLAWLAEGNTHLLKVILRGLEKESLRVGADGKIAQTDHPQALGATLTHPHITTDYSEALLEFITQPHTSVDALLGQLSDIHTFTYRHLGDEVLWGASMPCMIGADADIPVARYGNSNTGRMKTTYRIGLGHRYGRAMQTIAGVHYNFSFADELIAALHARAKSPLSFQDFKTQSYFDLIRNFRRYFWLLVYLYGAAPAVCRSFVRDRPHQLVPVGGDDHSLHLPHATSLRMGNLGYQSDAQASLTVCYNNLNTYLKTLCGAITQPHADYQAIGLKDAHGEYRQLNTALLQIENEFYSTIRPKRTSQRGETALNALHARGVEYIEVRCVDLNPYEPLGVTAEQLHFMDAFLLFCLLEQSPETNSNEYADMQENQRRIVEQGRDPNLTLLHNNQERNMHAWANELLAGIGRAAELLDTSADSNAFSDAVNGVRARVADPSQTPAARLLADMQAQGKTFYQLARDLAEQHAEYFKQRALTKDALTLFEKLAKQSLAAKAQIEREQGLSFEQYLADFYAQYTCCDKPKFDCL
ncbi:glutamate--cysteine ligase [Simiduia sp. 21SJ11W-1]|uniref:glutamate--cysteine ligase n=1 Tax=Simiduia sp. 21SJ11W-1 TaxID=2909669 RepID=UPI0020A178F2|nr:glutamate--cysteine ligase [Simiduia sp. 21SJ11W-1]UTA48039.1 glutamate--cysteine ligase [Simiduia sp. 21SJ11W-1]